MKPHSKKNKKISTDDIGSTILFRLLSWEPEINAFIAQHPPEFDVIEIGAHIGVHTREIADLVSGNNRRVIAFEPTPRTFATLQKNTAGVENVTLINKAVSDGSHDRLTFIDCGAIFSTLNTLGDNIRLPSALNWFIRKFFAKEIIIEATSLDSYLAEHEDINPSFLKIDVENAEILVLRGAQEILTKYRPTIILEGGDLNRTEDQKTKMTLDFLLKYDYSFFEYDKKSAQIIPHIIKDNYKSWLNILAIPSEKV